MPTSANVQTQSSSHAFENLEFDLSPDFDIFEEAEKGKKNADGTITFNQPGEVKEDQSAGGKKPIIGEEDEDEDGRYDDFLEKELDGKKPEGDDTDDKNKTADTEKKPAATDGNEENPNKVFYEMMVAAGHWEAVEDFDGSDEAFEKIREDNLEKSRDEDLDSYFDEAFEKNPEGKVYGKPLLKHLANGGKIADFLAVYSQDDITVDDLDNEDKDTAEQTAIAMLREYHSGKMKPERLTAFISDKKKKGLLIDTAKDIAPDFEELREANKKELEKTTTQNAVIAKNNARNYQKSVLDLTTTNETVGHITIGKTPKERKELADYMLQASVENQNGSKTSKFVADLNELRGNPEWNIVLAKTAKDFKAKKPASAQSTETKKPSTKDTIKEILERNKKPISSASSENIETPSSSAVKAAWSGLV